MKECPACRRCFTDDIAHCPDDGNATSPSIGGEPILDGRYQLERRLGQGGMGAVFKARHIFLKTQHAIKIILPDLVGNDPMLVTRFRQEALAAAAIRHQNIIAVTDFGVVRGNMPFLVMEFVQGKSLQEIMTEEGIMSPARAFELMQPICAGIAAAHRQKIVHRDLKPLNVMIQEGLPVNEGAKILDFGLAKIKSGELLGSFVAAQTTGLMGSPFYMAPEQWSDEEPDARADIYSLGVMLYQMLTGEVPFKGASIPSIMNKHLTTDVPSFASKGIEIPAQIENVVRHALEKDPKYRTASAEEFAEELRAAMKSAQELLKRAESGEIDPSKTILAPPPMGSTTASHQPGRTTLEDFSASLDDQEKTRFAQEELAREAEARRRFTDEEERKRKAEEDNRERERRHIEELVAQQTKALEEKLTQLASTMSPKAADPAQSLGGNTYPGAQSTAGVAAPAAPRKSALPIILSILAVVLILAAGAGFLALRSRANNPPTSPTRPDTLPANENAYKPELIEIPGGAFQIGRNDSLPQEAPAHDVTVDKFLMDKTEVTNGEYAQFVRDTNHAPPEQWGSVKPPAGQELVPVSNVSYEDAVAFAQWRSKERHGGLPVAY
jgi:serine/threonine-protein kinase